MKQYFKFVPCIFLFSSCNFGFNKALYKEEISKSYCYVVKQRHVDDGCRVLYFNTYRDGNLVEQVDVEFICNLFRPAKFIFKYDKDGKVISCKKLMGVKDNAYTYKLTEADKSAFLKLDSISNKWVNKNVTLADIKGFIENKEAEPYGFIPIGIKLSSPNE
jgi:hypothetical protein